MAGFREILPASLQTILQNGLLDHVFEDALVGSFLYDHLAEVREWEAQVGSTSILTKAGLMAPSIVPITGSDATAGSYGFEQYTLQMNQYGFSIDTNMLMSAFALASKFVEDNKTLGIHAAQSLDLVAQAALYGATGGGATKVSTGSTGTSVTLPVDDITGFANTVISVAADSTYASEGMGVPAVKTVVPVSGSNPGYVSINGATGQAYTAATAVGAKVGLQQPGTLTIASTAFVDGQAVVAVPSASSLVPLNSTILRATGRASHFTFVAGDIATLDLFRSAVTRLKAQHVPTNGGAYTAHISPTTLQELFKDAEFQSAYRGLAQTPAYVENRIGVNGGDATFLGRFAGIDWVENTYTPVTTDGGSAGTIPVYRDIVCGEGCLIKGPFANMGNLVGQMNAGGISEIQMIGGVARILRAPLDRLGQVLSSTWSWVGGYTVGTDLLTGDAAIYKRAVVVEHA